MVGLGKAGMDLLVLVDFGKQWWMWGAAVFGQEREYHRNSVASRFEMAVLDFEEVATVDLMGKQWCIVSQPNFQFSWGK